ncbi:hypothetical protein H4R33_005260 [Dimargaris cristalligena]|nr:hypothetical protein H4R33_005260 [Dimargaris cristalligena]
MTEQSPVDHPYQPTPAPVPCHQPILLPLTTPHLPPAALLPPTVSAGSDSDSNGSGSSSSSSSTGGGSGIGDSDDENPASPPPPPSDMIRLVPLHNPRQSYDIRSAPYILRTSADKPKPKPRLIAKQPCPVPPLKSVT